MDTAQLSDDIKIENFGFGLVNTVAGLDFVYTKTSGVLGLGKNNPYEHSFLS